jgi:hypothetical protein
LINLDVTELVSEYPIHSSDQENMGVLRDGALHEEVFPQNDREWESPNDGK